MFRRLLYAGLAPLRRSAYAVGAPLLCKRQTLCAAYADSEKALDTWRQGDRKVALEQLGKAMYEGSEASNYRLDGRWLVAYHLSSREGVKEMLAKYRVDYGWEATD